MPFQNRSTDLDRNTCVCSQAEAVEKFFLRKCISNELTRKMGGFSVFFTGKFMKPEKSSSWLERINRNEEWFNGKQFMPDIISKQCLCWVPVVCSLHGIACLGTAANGPYRPSGGPGSSCFSVCSLLHVKMKGIYCWHWKTVSCKLFLKLCILFLSLDTKSSSFAC